MALVGSFDVSGAVRAINVSSAGVLSDSGQVVSNSAVAVGNITVSPDGRLALTINKDNTIGIVNIAADGTISAGGLVTAASGVTFNTAQSLTFTTDGRHAYVYLAQQNKVAVLDIDSSHAVTDSGTRISVSGRGQVYIGLDQIATHASGAILLHLASTSNTATTGSVVVIDTATNTVTATITIPDDFDFGSGTPSTIRAGGGIAGVSN
jgi:hypothetical protein